MSADHRRKSSRANGAAPIVPELPPTSGEPLAFEEALGQLDDAVAALEDGQLSLAEALARYEEGVRLAARCQQLLDEAALRVQVLQRHTDDDDDDDDDDDGNGPFRLDPFEADEE
jgi:exodeoxyribonuclease VII small subunit